MCLKSAILNSMRLAPIASILMTCLTLNAQTIQGKVVRVSDGDTITTLDEMKVQHKVRLNRIDAPEKKKAFVGSEPIDAIKEKGDADDR